MLIVSFLLCCCSSSAVPTNERSRIDGIFYELSCSQKNMAEIEGYFESLKNLKVTSNFLKKEGSRDWPIGEALFNTLTESLKANNKSLIVKIDNQGDIGVNPDKTTGNLILTINLDKLRDSRVGCLMPIKKTVKRTKTESISWKTEDENAEFSHAVNYGPKVTEKSNVVYCVGDDENPPYVTLGHELIHAIHQLSMAQDTYQGRLGNFTSEWPVIDVDRDRLIWGNLEEQATVLGERNGEEKVGPQLSEFWLRIAAGRLPRYAYHANPADNNFLESEKIIKTIMFILMGENWLTKLNGLSTTLAFKGDAKDRREATYFHRYNLYMHEEGPWRRSQQSEDVLGGQSQQNLQFLIQVGDRATRRRLFGQKQ